MVWKFNFRWKNNFSDLVKFLSVTNLQNWQKTDYSRSFENLKVAEKSYLTFGRCFEIQPMKETDIVWSIKMIFLKPIYIYVNMPNQFFNVNNARSKLQANVGQKLYMEITYEILKENYAKTCKFYDLNAFDNCHIAEIEKRILKKFNCTVPFLTNPEHKVCSSNKNYKKASKYSTPPLLCNSGFCPFSM